MIAYYLELPCDPICESAAPSEAPVTSLAGVSEIECHDGISVMRKDVGVDSICQYSTEPILIEELNDSGSGEVRFSFTNNWGVSLDNIDLYYDRGDGLGQQCQSLYSLGRGDMYPNTMAAACDVETQMAEIEVYISDGSISHTSSLGKCGDHGAGSCSYVYRIPCSTDVACEYERRLESESESEGGEKANEFELNYDTEDTPYCLHKDYPCEGDDKNMVYVCHYSSQAGYQTFCIPEMDSDILRFNENHHCGPCDGWNGSEHNAVVN